MAAERDARERLQKAIKHEERYDQIQKAKFKAAAEGVDYDTFHNRVLTAHLKPINAPKEHTAASSASRREQIEQLDVYKERVRAQEEQMSRELLEAAEEDLITTPPSSYADFERAWTRGCSSDSQRVSYLHVVGAERVPELFAGGVGLEQCLGQAVQSCCVGMEGLDVGSDEGVQLAGFVLDLLGAFARVDRFDMAVMFFSREEKAAVDKLFGLLAAHGTSLDQEVLQATQSSYS